MAMTPAENTSVIPLGPSPWEQAARKADAGQVAHLADDTGEHRYVVMTEEQYLAIEQQLEDAAEDRWLTEEVAPKIHAARRARAAGERGIPAAELRAEAEAELAR